MVLVAPEVNQKFVIFDTLGQKLLYTKLEEAIYGLLDIVLLLYGKLWSELHGKGFEINPYDIYVANNIITGII